MVRFLPTQQSRLVLLAVMAVSLVTLLQVRSSGSILGRETRKGSFQPGKEESSRHNTTPSDEDLTELLRKGPLKGTDPRLLKWVREGGGSRIFQPSLLPYNVTNENLGGFRDSVVYKFYVKLIKKFLISKVGGFFLEAGALDGYLLSTTLALEKDRAWSGLLVEPRPDMFQKLLEKQRKAFAARFCLSETPNLYKKNDWLSPDYMKGSIAAYGAVGSRVYKKVPAGQREIGSLVSVHCIPAATLLTALDVTHVDLFVLDVEGSEWGVIENFPFDQITVDMLAVERKDRGQNDRRAFIKMIENKGFKLLDSLHEDYVFIRIKADFLVFDQDWQGPEIYT